jgi:hypothetical protein
MADRLGMLKTGGSDFHGAPKPHVFLGTVTNGVPAPYELLERIKAAAGAIAT